MRHPEFQGHAQVRAADDARPPAGHLPGVKNLLPKRGEPGRAVELGRGDQEAAAALHKGPEGGLGLLVHFFTQPDHHAARLRVVRQQTLVDRALLGRQVQHVCLQPQVGHALF